MKTDAFVIFCFAIAVFFLVFLAIRYSVVKSLKTLPQQDRSAYMQGLKQQRRTQEQTEEAHASMMEVQQTRAEDFQNMRENTGLAPEDMQQRQKDYMRDQQQRIKDMQRLNTR